MHDSIAPPARSQQLQPPPTVDLTRTQSPDLRDYQIVAADLLTGDVGGTTPASTRETTPASAKRQDDSWVDLEQEKEVAPGPTRGTQSSSEPEIILRAKPGPSRPVQYYVEIEPEIHNGKPLLGLRIAADSDKNIFVTGKRSLCILCIHTAALFLFTRNVRRFVDFSPHPQTKEPLPISKRVELMDRLIEANGRSLSGCTVDDAVTILTSRADTVSLLLQSSYKTIPSWFCKSCGNQNYLTEPAPELSDIPVVCSFCDKTSMFFVHSDV